MFRWKIENSEREISSLLKWLDKSISIYRFNLDNDDINDMIFDLQIMVNSVIERYL